MQQFEHMIVTLKAFGDFVIAANIVKEFRQRHTLKPIGIIAGNHVFGLANAMNMLSKVMFVGGERACDVPAIFDIKRQGIFAALMSLKELRSALAKTSPTSALVFDRLGLRERLIGARRIKYSLPTKAGNIYSAYTLALESLGYEKILSPRLSKNKISVASIIPGARMPHRVIPNYLLSQIKKLLNCYGIECRVILLDGELYDVPCEIDTILIPRDFRSLIAAISSSDVVISADSLSAHLSGYFDVPMFVFTPVPEWSVFWLPQFAYNSSGMAGFEDLAPFDSWLEQLN